MSKPGVEGLIGASEAPPRISITPVTYPYNEYLNQLTLQVRGGQFTGAAQLDVAWLGALAALGKLHRPARYTEGRGYTDAALQRRAVRGQAVRPAVDHRRDRPDRQPELLDQVGANDARPTTSTSSRRCCAS